MRPTLRVMFLDPNQDIRKHRDRLPHWHQDGTAVFLTWRLADSLPAEVVGKLDEVRMTWMDRNPKPWSTEQAAEYNRKFILPLEDKLDANHGGCVLRRSDIRRIVEHGFHHFDGERYRLDAYVIMPNHVHLLMILDKCFLLENVVHSLKSFTAKEINRATQGQGNIWQRGYWDRLIRTQKHLAWTRVYIEKNPKKLPLEDFTLWRADGNERIGEVPAIRDK